MKKKKDEVERWKEKNKQGKNKQEKIKKAAAICNLIVAAL